jgi:hypothetical protein
MAKASSTEKTITRPRKTPAERAQLDYDKAQKAYDKAVERRDKIAADIADAESEVSRTKRYLDFAKMNPDLPPQATEEAEDDATDVPEDASSINTEARELQPA